MKKLLSLVVVMFFTTMIYAQEVTLTVIGTGVNEKEATLQALRSAIEQTYGAFVSANTTILNDNLVKDEIVSRSKGNVKKYEKLSVTPMSNGHVSILLKVTVSIDKLISYAKSKGSEVEFAGSVYSSNAKLLELKIKSIKKTYEEMVQQLEFIAQEMFDFEIVVGDPKRYQSAEFGDIYRFESFVIVKHNEASLKFYDFHRKTLDELKLTNEEIALCRNEGIEINTITMSSFREEIINQATRGWYGEPITFDKIVLPFTANEYKSYVARLNNAIYNACHRFYIYDLWKGENVYAYYKVTKADRIKGVWFNDDFGKNSDKNPAESEFLGGNLNDHTISNAENDLALWSAKFGTFLLNQRANASPMLNTIDVRLRSLYWYYLNTPWGEYYDKMKGIGGIGLGYRDDNYSSGYYFNNYEYLRYNDCNLYEKNINVGDYVKILGKLSLAITADEMPNFKGFGIEHAPSKYPILAE